MSKQITIFAIIKFYVELGRTSKLCVVGYLLFGYYLYRLILLKRAVLLRVMVLSVRLIVAYFDLALRVFTESTCREEVAVGNANQHYYLYDVYFACALHEAGKKECELYDDLGRLLSKLGLKVYLPHLEVQEIDQVPCSFWLKGMERVARSRVLVLYAGLPSIRAGQELEHAVLSQRPAVVILEKGKQLETFVEAVADGVIRFTDTEDLIKQLIPFLIKYIH